MLHAALVEQSRSCIEVGPPGDLEAEVVESDPERVEAICCGRSLGVDRSEADEHPFVHQDHATLERVDDRLVALVPGGRRSIHRDSEAQYLGIEGDRPLHIGDRQAQVVDRANRKVRHGDSWMMRRTP